MKAKVVKNDILSPHFGYIELHCPEIAQEKHAGRFFLISTHDNNSFSTDPLLKRPFSICDMPTPETFTGLYKIVGRGTAILSNAKVGVRISYIKSIKNYKYI